MANRTILFGYRMENCKIVIDETERETVLRIFNSYISGETLKQISEVLTAEKVVYFDESSNWNKSMINRIIENKKYTGLDGYPIIIAPSIYEKANALKSGGKKAKLSEENELIRSLLYCKECSARYRRINKWRTREKWLCTGGCKCGKYYDDKVLTSEILSLFNMVITNPSLLDNHTQNSISQTPELNKMENQLNWLLDQPDIDYKSTMKSVIEAASLKYDQIIFGKSGYITDELKKQLQDLGEVEILTTEMIKRFVKRILISISGDLLIEFINGVTVEKGNDKDGSNAKQDSNEN